jgi:hypothetical protein
MFKILKADKDTYITNKVIRSSRVTESNVGYAATLDLFKLYGASMSGTTPNTELSRLLIHFDISGLRSLVDQKKLDPSDSSFWCKIKLKDVYGGQPTPSNFTVSVFPLSASFEEGIGKDITHFTDLDWSNWSSSSFTSAWFVSGCGGPCDASSLGDYITSSYSIVDTENKQVFKTGEEDLEVDVTKIVSATLSGELPDSGFRISFENSLEDDQRTYFVKRFGSRNAYDETKHPALLIGFNDSICDDSQNLTLDTSCRIVMYNYAGGDLTNIVSGSSLTPVTGSNCVLLKMTTPVSGGFYDLYFTGSQLSLGTDGNRLCEVSGTYYADVVIPMSDVQITTKLLSSSSIPFVPVWTSLDAATAYVTGTVITAYPPTRTQSSRQRRFVVSVSSKDSYDNNEEAYFRVNIFDQSNPLIKVVKVPVELPGVVVKTVHYQVRDAVTNSVIIPFETSKDSTKVSSDSEGMFFKLDMSSLIPSRTYVIDTMITHNGSKTRYENSSPIFRVNKNVS